MEPSAQQLERIKQLFERASALSNEEISAFLDRECSDDPVARAEVERLLRQDLRTSAPRPIGDHSPEAPATGGAAVSSVRSGGVLAHYLLTERLGAGGMGEVYRATDTALGRDAAVKVLKAGMPAEMRARLLREARNSARLQHPCVATFYESGEWKGIAFLALEYIAGETLRRQLDRGALAAAEAMSMAGCVLEALAHAHAVGILHRDIKPENVMMTGDGTAKVLDFGIAKEIFTAEDSALAGDLPTVTTLTAHGAIAGTIAYMSPEQLLGKPLGPSSDLFAVGVLLYEALAGCRPFPGDSVAETIASLLSTEPPALELIGAPSGLQDVLQRALAREPADRYAKASEFLADLRSVATGEAIGILPDTLAIVDFENLRGNEEDDWIGSGTAESLGTDLARVEGLAPVPRAKMLKAHTGLAAQKDSIDALDVALALGCRWMLTGSYQRMGTALRLTARLVEVSTGRSVWTEKFDGTLEGIFEVQDRLARVVAESLELVLPEDRGIEAAAPDLGAFECFARGRRAFFSFRQGALEEAERYFTRAIELDPSHAPALAALAQLYAPARYLMSGDKHDLETALEFAGRALESDPSCGDAHMVRGYALWRLERKTEAMEQFERASELDPSQAMPVYFAGCCLTDLGRPADAVPYLQRAIQIDRLFAWSQGALGWAHAEVGRFDEARWSLEQTIELDRQSPDTWPTIGFRTVLAEVLRRSGELDRGRRECLRALDEIEATDHVMRDLHRATALTVLGRTALDQGDRAAAEVAYGQALTQVEGRPSALGTGHVAVQALAGRTRAGGGPEPYEEGLRLFEERRQYDFGWFYIACDGVTLLELSRAAATLERDDEADSLLERARRAGSGEALAK